MIASTLKHLAAAALAGACSLAALAQPGQEALHGMPPPPGMAEFGPPPGTPLPPFLHGLKLNETQQDKIFAILHAQAPQMREQAKAQKKAQEALRDLALSGRFDEARARALAETGARARAEMDFLRARSDDQILALLSPEQRQGIDGKNCR